jgi:hypothetical protein
MNGTLPEHRASVLHLGATGLLLLVAAVTTGWLALNFVYPDFETFGIRRVVTRVVIHATILIGLWLALSRTDFSSAIRVVVWLVIAIPFTLWLAVIWRLAINGTFRPILGSTRVPPLPIAIFAPVVVGLVLLMRSKRIAAVLDAAPPSWLVGVQVYRIFGGIFLISWARGSIPGVFALPAAISDVLVGVLALPIALYVSTGTSRGQSAGIALNLLGLTDFAIAIAMGAMSSPGRLQVLSVGQPNVQMGTYPTVMIPAFTVPSSIIFHVLSLWQLRRLARKVQGAAR